MSVNAFRIYVEKHMEDAEKWRVCGFRGWSSRGGPLALLTGAAAYATRAVLDAQQDDRPRLGVRCPAGHHPPDQPGASGPPILHSLSSALLGGVGRDAAHIFNEAVALTR